MNMMVLITALIAIESGGDNKAVGDSGKAVGCLQIHPIFVIECNRIIGDEHFSLSDRLDRNKSREMAEIWLTYYRGRFEERFDREPTYEELAIIFNRGFSGYSRITPEARKTDDYAIKVRKALDDLCDW